MSECLLFNDTWAIHQLCHGVEMRYVVCMLCTRPTRLVGLLSYIVLAHWNNSQRVDMSLHSDTLFRFRTYQCLLCAKRRSNKYQFYNTFFLVWPYYGSNLRSTTLKASTLTITSPMQLMILNIHVIMISYWPIWLNNILCLPLVVFI